MPWVPHHASTYFCHQRAIKFDQHDICSAVLSSDLTATKLADFRTGRDRQRDITELEDYQNHVGSEQMHIIETDGGISGRG